MFATLSVVQFKQLGIALAAAVFIDATIVRIVLLPALNSSAAELVSPGWLAFIDRRPSVDQLLVANHDRPSRTSPRAARGWRSLTRSAPPTVTDPNVPVTVVTL